MAPEVLKRNRKIYEISEKHEQVSGTSGPVRKTVQGRSETKIQNPTNATKILGKASASRWKQRGFFVSKRTTSAEGWGRGLASRKLKGVGNFLHGVGSARKRGFFKESGATALKGGGNGRQTV